MIKTFISHTSSDHHFIEWLSNKLARANLGLDIFVDDNEIIVGDDPQKMIEEVKRSLIFIPVLSNESVKKNFVLNELKTAINSDHANIFPIKFKCDDENIPDEIKTNFSEFDKASGKIYEDFSNEKEWEDHYEILRKAVLKKIIDLGLYKDGNKEFYQDCEVLDLILSRKEPTANEIKIVIDIYLKKEDFQRYFFNKLTNIHWLKYLFYYGYFKYNPGPVEDITSPGYFSIPHWPVLDYLDNISKQTSNSSEVTEYLLKIIPSVTLFKTTDGKYIDNYRTWHCFVNILLNLPNDKIPTDIIDLIPIWLDSRFETILQGADIANKLLKKFLPYTPSKEDIEKAERIVRHITELKPLPPEKEKSVFSRGKDKYRLPIDHYWLLEAFKKHAGPIGVACSSKIVEDLSGKIKKLLPRSESSVPVDIGEQPCLLSLSAKEGQYRVKIYDTVEIPASEIITKIMTDEECDANVIKEIHLPECARNEFVEKVYEQLSGASLFQQANPDFLKKKIFNLYRNFYDKETDKSFYEESKHSPSDPKEMLTFILKRVFLAKAEVHIEETEAILKAFFNEKYFYFSKMALYVIGNYPEKYSALFWDALESEAGDVILESTSFGDELKHLLLNLKDMSLEQKSIFKRKIEKGPSFLPEKDENKYVDEWKQQRYQTLIHDPYFKELYDELKEQTGKDMELTPAIGQVKTRSGHGPSPLNRKEIMEKPNPDIAEFMAEFKTKDFWEGPSVDGLGEELKAVATENSDKFTNEFSCYLNSSYYYVYKILSGMRDAWNGKQDIDWGSIFEFILQYMDRKEYWEDKYVIDDGGWKANHCWISGITSELIQDGTRDDSWAFPEKHFVPAEKTLSLILDNLPVEKYKPNEDGDYVADALNSPFGKAITALIFLSLRILRFVKKKETPIDQERMDKFKQRYNELLDKGIIEAFTCFGQYLPNLLYMDQQWATEKIEGLKREQGLEYWEAFMDGYLLHGTLYDNLYPIMKPHYENGINFGFKSHRNRELLVQHIALVYLRGKEEMDQPEGLFFKIINSGDVEQIKEVLYFFWSQDKHLEEDNEENKIIKERILAFWKHLFEKYQKKKELGDGDKKILSASGKLATYLPKIDQENFNWLMLSASYVDVNHSAYFFIEYLDRLKDQGKPKESADYTGKIFLKVLDACKPTFDKTHIRSIVKFLFENKTEEKAREICNIYKQRGLDFLDDIYDKFKSH